MLPEPKQWFCNCVKMQTDGRCDVHRSSGSGNWPPLMGAMLKQPEEPTYTRADLEAFARWVLESHWLTPSLHYRNNPAALVEAWEKERAAPQKKAGE